MIVAEPKAVANVLGVAGVAVVRSEVVGAHVTVWVAFATVTVIVVVALL